MLRVEQAFFDRTQAVNNSGEYLTADIPYFVFDAEDETEAVAAVYEASPFAFQDMARESVGVEERINEGTFKVVARYQKLDDDEETPPTIYSFDTGGGTQHLTQSIETVNKYPSKAPDYQGAIGYDGENVTGVDIIQPTLNLTETHYFAEEAITNSFIANLARKTGMYNTDSFRGFDAGEVLFLGASGNLRDSSGDSKAVVSYTYSKDDSDSLWEVVYRFAVSTNRTNFRVGDITVSSKLGWEYMWVRYADNVDDKAKTLVKTPVAVYIEKIYEGTNFSGLGLGGD